jgi:PIN domain nuclease of toxin-antitoxin system
VKLLLDTHVLLWWLDDHTKLTDEAYKAIENVDNQIFVSAATSWEIAIKKSIGKMSAPDNLEEELEKHKFEVLNISISHTWKVRELPFHHSDPFDRLLISQAIYERLTIVTHDSKMKKYNVPLIIT